MATPKKAESPKPAKKADAKSAPKSAPKPAAKVADKQEPSAPVAALPVPASRVHEKYKKEIVPDLATKLGKTNPHSLPKLQKIVLNMGVGKALQDKNRMEQAVVDLSMITGQRPQITKSRIAVSGFRLREDNEIGCRVTLRGKRMYEFLDRLVSVALPRIRDFRGINPDSFDGNGNYSFGVSEQLIFPEIEADKMNFTQGMDITFVTSTSSDDEARELLKAFGMPFRDTTTN
jgi:large subunit ribosomal protein L5